MKDVNVILAERIRQARKANNVTREKLAELIEVSPRFLAEVESGKVGVSLQTLKNISLALSTPADVLLGLDSEDRLNRFNLICAQLASVDEKYFPLISALALELKSLNEK